MSETPDRLYGIIAKNKNINDTIYSCFKYISETDQRKFVKKFRKQCSDNDQVMHTFRELIVGAYLGKSGWTISYEEKYLDKKPEWSIQRQDGQIAAILELTNFHNAQSTESAIRASLDANQMYCGWLPDPTHRLYQSIQKKVNIYEELAKTLSVPYIVAIYGTYLAMVEEDEVYDVLHRAYGGGIFAYSTFISGVLFFAENGGRYKFYYFDNPSAEYRIKLPNGIL